MCEYGFTEGVDFNVLKNERVQIEGEREVVRKIFTFLHKAHRNALYGVLPFNDKFITQNAKVANLGVSVRPVRRAACKSFSTC